MGVEIEEDTLDLSPFSGELDITEKTGEERADKELKILIKARYPLLYIVSWEEKRVESSLGKIADKLKKKLYVWTYTDGIKNASYKVRKEHPTRDPIKVLDYILRSNEQEVLFLLKDFHPYLSDSAVIRRLRDLTEALRETYKTLIILSPTLKLPLELEKEITVIDYDLPRLEYLDGSLEGIIQIMRDNKNVDVNLEPHKRERILKAALGLTAREAESVFAKSLIQKGHFDVDIILAEKEQIIRKSGILEYYHSSDTFAEVGGVEVLKDWLKKRAKAFTEKARKFGLPQPKGILLVGVMGCGKSLVAKSVAGLWRLPLLRLDMGKIFGGIVGASEENIRKAIKVAESIAPTVMWLDEMDKGLAGTQSSSYSDAGTTSRVFGTFITWLQEKKSPVFVIATVNNVSQLPPELLRRGRFDEIFFVDLPRQEERVEIFDIHLRKRGRDPAKFDLPLLAERTEGFSGAEIEQAIISSLYDAFDADRDLIMDDILRSIEETIPLSQMMKEEIEGLRDWAKSRARSASHSFDGKKAGGEWE